MYIMHTATKSIRYSGGQCTTPQLAQLSTKKGLTEVVDQRNLFKGKRTLHGRLPLPHALDEP